jgi:hypothetical protein
MQITRRDAGMGAFAVALAACARTEEAPADTPAAAPAPFRFPLRIEPGKRQPLDATGRPFFLHGDTAWSMVAELRREGVETYLQDRAQRGVNGVLCNVLEAFHASNAPRNAYGDGPFRGGKIDFGAPNDAYFQHFDFILRRAAELNILLLAAPAYLGAEGKFAGVYQEMVAAGPAKVRAYGEFLGKRYAGADNILWIMGGDYTPPDLTLVRALAEGIGAGGSKGLISGHPRPYQNAREAFGESWLTIDDVYTYGSVAEASRRSYVQERLMPFFMFESAYENEGDTTQARLRQQAYEALLCGAFGHVFGSSPIWHFSGPGTEGRRHPDWRQGLNSPGMRAMDQARALFLSLPWWTLRPDLEARFLKMPFAENAPVAAVSEDGAVALLYAAKAATLPLDFRVVANARATWVDPVSGARTPLDGTASGIRDISTPGTNAGGDGDWLLLVRRG